MSGAEGENSRFDRGALELFARAVLHRANAADAGADVARSSGGERGANTESPLVLSAGRAEPAELRALAGAGLRLEAFTEAAPPKPLPLAGVQGAPPRLERQWQSSFLLLSLPRERYDGIWSHLALEALPPEGWQRMLGIYFAALKPGGLLFFSFRPSPARPENEVASLLRQNGFQHLSRGEAEAPSANGDGASVVGYLARRIA